VYYSGEVKNIYTTLWQIYSGKYVQTFTRIDRVRVFQFTVSIAVQLENANGKFHKVM